MHFNLIQEYECSLKRGPIGALPEGKGRKLVHRKVCGQSSMWSFKLSHRENEPWAAAPLLCSPEAWACHWAMRWHRFARLWGRSQEANLFCLGESREWKSILCLLSTLILNNAISNARSDKTKQSHTALGRVPRHLPAQEATKRSVPSCCSHGAAVGGAPRRTGSST